MLPGDKSFKASLLLCILAIIDIVLSFLYDIGIVSKMTSNRFNYLFGIYGIVVILIYGIEYCKKLKKEKNNDN